MTFVQDYEKCESFSPDYFISKLYSLFSQPTKKRKIKGKGYSAGWDREGMLTQVGCMKLLAALFHMTAQSNDVPMSAKQNARSARFYWAQENSLSKLQWVSSIPLLVRQCHSGQVKRTSLHNTWSLVLSHLSEE